MYVHYNVQLFSSMPMLQKNNIVGLTWKKSVWKNNGSLFSIKIWCLVLQRMIFNMAIQLPFCWVFILH